MLDAQLSKGLSTAHRTQLARRSSCYARNSAARNASLCSARLLQAPPQQQAISSAAELNNLRIHTLELSDLWESENRSCVKLVVRNQRARSWTGATTHKFGPFGAANPLRSPSDQGFGSIYVLTTFQTSEWNCSSSVSTDLIILNKVSPETRWSTDSGDINSNSNLIRLGFLSIIAFNQSIQHISPFTFINEILCCSNIPGACSRNSLNLQAQLTAITFLHQSLSTHIRKWF